MVIEANDMDKCMRLDCDHAYKEICEKLDLICKRAVWDTDDEGYWQENYKGIDDWELREL